MGIRRVTLIGESKIGPEDDDVDVLGKSSDQAECLRQGCPAFEEKPRVAGRQAVVESVENKADPEILLDIGRERPQALGRRSEDVELDLLPVIAGSVRMTGSHDGTVAVNDFAHDAGRPIGKSVGALGEIALYIVGQATL